MCWDAPTSVRSEKKQPRATNVTQTSEIEKPKVCFSFLSLLSLFLRRSAHSSWGLQRRQSKAWLNRSECLTALCVFVCVCVCFLMRVHTKGLTGAFYKRPQGTAAMAFASHIAFSPSSLVRLVVHIYSSFIVSFPLAFFQLSILLPPNSTQSFHPFTILSALFTFLLTSTPNLPHLSFFQSSSQLAKCETVDSFMTLSTDRLSFIFHGDT